MTFQDEAEYFSTEDIEIIVKTSINNVLKDAMYNSAKVDDWSSSIIDSTLKGLQSLNRPFKYVVTTVLVQKNGGGLVSSSSFFWDDDKDGVSKVTWENETIHALITVFGLSVHIDSPPEDS